VQDRESADFAPVFVDQALTAARRQATVRRRSLRACVPMSSSAGYASALDALGPAPRAELLHVLMLLDFEPADRRGIHRSQH